MCFQSETSFHLISEKCDILSILRDHPENRIYQRKIQVRQGPEERVPGSEDEGGRQGRAGSLRGGDGGVPGGGRAGPDSGALLQRSPLPCLPQELSKRFSAIRKTKGDGNCFYRALGYSYLESLLGKSREVLK